MSEETWIQTAEKITLFRNQGRGAEAARLLEISPTNRGLHDQEQATILLVNRIVALRFRNLYPDDKVKYAWIDQIIDRVEEHQLTIEWESRKQFMKVAIAQFQGAVNKAKNEIDTWINK